MFVCLELWQKHQYHLTKTYLYDLGKDNILNWFSKSNSNHCALVATGHAWLSIVELNCAACVSSEKRTLHYVVLWVKILILSVEWALSFSIEIAGASQSRELASPRSWNWKEKQSYTSQVCNINTDCILWQFSVDI